MYKAVTINGKPVKEIKLNGATLYKKNPEINTYLFPTGTLVCATFDTIELSLNGDSFYYEVNVDWDFTHNYNNLWLLDNALIIRQGIRPFLIYAPDGTLMADYINYGRKEIFTKCLIEYKDDKIYYYRNNTEDGELLLMTQTEQFPIRFNRLSHHALTNLIVRAVAVNGEEPKDLSKLPGLEFTSNYELV